MTRKDYKLIARSINEAATIIRNSKTIGNSDQLKGIELSAVSLAIDLKDTNPRFDRARFLKACGFDD